MDSANHDTHGATLVRDFIPIAYGDEGFMFDRLSGEWRQYGNKGTGNFTLGELT